MWRAQRQILLATEGTGGGTGNLQAAFVPSRLELKAWGDWDNVRGTAADPNQIRDLVARVKVNMPLNVQGCFDWDAIEQEQGNYELKMMAFLRCKTTHVSICDRKRSYTFLTRELADKPLAVRCEKRQGSFGCVS